MSERGRTYDDDDAALAGEYVLRLMSAEEERAFAARLDGDAALRREVALWQEALGELGADVEPVDPPARVLAAVEARLFEGGEGRQSAGGDRGWRGLLARPWAAVMLAAAAIALVAFLTVAVLRPFVDPVLVADLGSDSGDFLVEVSVDAQTGQGRLERQAGGPPPGRVMQLWILPEGADGPTSLGILPDAGPYDFIVPADLRDALGGALVEVSEEPPGGSPQDGPTGEVLGLGRLGRD